MELFLACIVFCCCGGYAKAFSEVPEDPSMEVTTFTFTDPSTEVVYYWNVSFGPTWDPPISFKPSAEMTLMTIIQSTGFKTSLTAAALTCALRSPARVFLGTLLALVLVTMVSAGLGLVLIRSVVFWEQLVSAFLLMMFSFKMLREAKASDSASKRSDQAGQSTCADNVEMASVNVDNPYKDTVTAILRDPDVDAETKQRILESRPELKEFLSSALFTESTSGKDELADDQKSVDTMVTMVNTEAGGWKRIVVRWISLEAFAMTFLIEWGDLSQYSTRNLLAQKVNIYGVVIGATLGHALCTLVAVLLGLFLSRFFFTSQKSASYFGAVVFFFLAGISILFALEVSDWQ